MEARRRTIVAIDFDGTMVDFSYPNLGNIKQGALDFIRNLCDKCDFILWTCRTGKELKQIEKYLQFFELPFAAINKNVPYLPFKTSNKIFADFYIDDRAGFDGDWKKMEEKVLSFEPDDFIIKSE